VADDQFLNIQIVGLDRIQKGLAAMNGDLKNSMQSAGIEAATEILDKGKGLRSYPPLTAANSPPTPYYKRGEGMQRAGRRKPEYNDRKSRKYGTLFYVKSQPAPFSTTIGNSAPYAPYLAGEEQAKAMGKIGWRRLIDVATQKAKTITKIYQDWIDRLIKMHGL
jgi:hypothetical protein